MVSLRSLRVAALALLTFASLALPVHTSALASPAGSGVVAKGPMPVLDMTKSFYTDLQGAIYDNNKTVIGHVYLSVTKDADSSTIDLDVSVTNASNSATGSYIFRVPATTDLTLAPKGKTTISSAQPYFAVLDTGTDAYDKTDPKNTIKNHIVVDWTYQSASPVNIQADPCTGTKASTAIQVVTTATATVDLPYPCDGATGVTVSGSANLDSARLPVKYEYQDKVIYYTTVTAIKVLSGLPTASTTATKGPMKSLMVMGSKRGTATSLTVYETTAMSVDVGLQYEMQMATDDKSASTLTTGGGHAATLNYSGNLGTADLVFDGSSSTTPTTGTCVNPNAVKGDLSKPVDKVDTQGTVSGPVDLKLCSAEIKATYGTGDIGSVTAYQKGSAALIHGKMSGLPGGVYIKGTIPTITGIDPAPGSTISPTQSVTVTFASALPAGSMVMITLTPSAGGTSSMMGPAMLTSGGTSQVSLTPKSALAAGTYNLSVSAIAPGGQNMAIYPSPMGGYKATYTVK